MDLTVEMKLWSDDIRAAIVAHAEANMPKVDGYRAVINHLPYFSGPVTVLLVKDSGTEPAE